MEDQINKIRVDLKSEIITELKSDLKSEIIAELKSDLKSEIIAELKSTFDVKIAESEILKTIVRNLISEHPKVLSIFVLLFFEKILLFKFKMKFL